MCRSSNLGIFRARVWMQLYWAGYHKYDYSGDNKFTVKDRLHVDIKRIREGLTVFGVVPWENSFPDPEWWRSILWWRWSNGYVRMGSMTERGMERYRGWPPIKKKHQPFLKNFARTSLWYITNTDRNVKVTRRFTQMTCACVDESSPSVIQQHK